MSTVPLMTTYSILWHFVFPASGFALYATCCKIPVLCLGGYFSMTNRRILSQFHDVFLKHLIKICSSLRHIVAYNSLLLSEPYGFRRGMPTGNTALNVLCSNQNILYALFLEIARRQSFICRRFETFCSFSLAGECEEWIRSSKNASNLAQVNVLLSVSLSRVWPRSWAL